MMELDDRLLEAQGVKKIAESHEMQSVYWQMVLGALLEDRETLDASYFKQEKRRVEKAIRKYTKLARRVNITHNKLIRRYNKKGVSYSCKNQMKN